VTPRSHTDDGRHQGKKNYQDAARGIEIRRCDPLKGQYLIAWITNRASLYGKKIDRDAAFLLADATAGNVWFMASEIEKLCLYIVERPSITIKDVEFLVMRSVEPPIFSFLDSLFDRKRDVSGKLAELESSGVSELEIISRIEKLTTQHYQVLVENQRSIPGINPFVEKKIAQRKSLWTARQLVSLLSSIRRIEHSIKSGRTLHPYTAVHETIMDVMSPA
jgi:DNA polymerase-3 subunit delta